MKFRRKMKTPAPPPALEQHSDVSSILAASHAVNSALGVEEALRVVLVSAKQLLRAHEGSVMLLGGDGNLRILASDGIPAEIASSVAIPLGEGIAGKVAQTGAPALLADRPDPRQFQSLVDRDRHLRSAVSVPLKAAGRTIGVLNLNITTGDRVFGPDDVAMAQVFGEQAAMAIHKAQLLEDSQQREADLALLFDASKELIGLLDLEPLLTRILDGAVKLAPSRAGFVCLMEEAAGKLSLGIYRGLPRHEIRRILGLPSSSELFAGDSLRVIDARSHEAFQEISEAGERATLVPMRAEGQTRALLVLIGTTPSPNQIRLLQTFAAQAALALRNAQLYRQVDEKETELASIVFSMPNPVVVVDDRGNVVVANPAAEELFGFSTSFVKGRPVREVLSNPELEALLTGAGETSAEVAAGEPVPRIYKARSATINAPEGGNRGRVLVLDDVTAEREVENLKSDFVAVIGHELRTPLTIIKGFLKTLLRRGDALSLEQRHEALQAADGQAQKLERLIGDLLFISRIEVTGESLSIETVNLVEVADGLLQEFRARELRRTFSLHAPDVVKIGLDRTKIEQALFHLLDNACKYSEDDAPVSVEIAERAEEVEVSVIDKGIGILSGDLPLVFDRFHQVDLSSTRKHGGTGVGLYIAKRFLEEHRGRISAQSVWGKGSTFSFTIPKGLDLSKSAPSR